VESTIQACRDLRPREALELVSSKSRQQMPTDDRLLSLEARLNERIQQLSVDERRADFLARAEEGHEGFPLHGFAVHILEACQLKTCWRGSYCGCFNSHEMRKEEHAPRASEN